MYYITKDTLIHQEKSDQKSPESTRNMLILVSISMVNHRGMLFKIPLPFSCTLFGLDPNASRI